MPRWTIAALSLLLLLMSAVVVAAVYLVSQNRSELLRQFMADQAKQVTEAARVLDEDFKSIAADLAFTGELVQSAGSAAERQRSLAALLALGRSYERVDVFDAQGGRTDSLHSEDPGASDGLALQLAEMAALSLRAAPGNIITTPPIERLGRGSVRVFSTAFLSSDRSSTAGAVALLVDTAPLFQKLRLVTAGQSSRLLLLGTHGRPTSVSDPELSAAVSAVEAGGAHEPLLGSTLRQMREGRTGTVLLPAENAARYGLREGEIVVAFAAIPIKGGSHWSLATFAPLVSVRRHERVTGFRLTIATIAFSLCLAILGAFVVVAARRATAMTERLRHADRVAHLHEKTDKILDNIPTGVIALSAEGRISSVNRVLRDKLKASPVGAELQDALLEAPPAVVGRLKALCEHALVGGKVQSLIGEQIALFGQEGRYSIHVVPLEARYPEARVLLVIEDLSDLQSLESQLVRAEKLATVGTLAAGIAHEIGTPLGVVRGRAEYLAGKLGEGHQHQGNLSIIIQEIDRVTRTIRQLLNFARVTPTVILPVDLGGAVRAVLELLRFEVERRKVELTLTLADALPSVAADPDQLQQVLVNLVMNACDACEPGERIHISAEATEPGSAPGWRRVRVQVRDNGKGIPDEDRPRVFDPFFTTKKRGQGTGLGLSMVAQIVRNHGAQIELETAAGRGTTVTLLWPAAVHSEEGAHEPIV